MLDNELRELNGSEWGNLEGKIGDLEGVRGDMEGEGR